MSTPAPTTQGTTQGKSTQGIIQHMSTQGMTDTAAATPSWDALSARMRPFIRARVASDADADDVLQEVLLRMHRGLPGLSDEQRLIAWTYRIARNAITDHLRRRARHPLAAPAAEQQHDDGDSSGPDSDDDASARALAGSVGYFVAQLPEPYRAAITLTDLQGHTQQQAADMLGVSLSAMKSRVARGRVKLRKALQQCCEIALDARGKVVDFEPRKEPGCECC